MREELNLADVSTVLQSVGLRVCLHKTTCYWTEDAHPSNAPPRGDIAITAHCLRHRHTLVMCSTSRQHHDQCDIPTFAHDVVTDSGDQESTSQTAAEPLLFEVKKLAELSDKFRASIRILKKDEESWKNGQLSKPATSNEEKEVAKSQKSVTTTYDDTLIQAQSLLFEMRKLVKMITFLQSFPKWMAYSEDQPTINLADLKNVLQNVGFKAFLTNKLNSTLFIDGNIAHGDICITAHCLRHQRSLLMFSKGVQGHDNCGESALTLEKMVCKEKLGHANAFLPQYKDVEVVFLEVAKLCLEVKDLEVSFKKKIANEKQHISDVPVTSVDQEANCSRNIHSGKCEVHSSASSSSKNDGDDRNHHCTSVKLEVPQNAGIRFFCGRTEEPCKFSEQPSAPQLTEASSTFHPRVNYVQSIAPLSWSISPPPVKSTTESVKRPEGTNVVPIIVIPPHLSNAQIHIISSSSNRPQNVENLSSDIPQVATTPYSPVVVGYLNPVQFVEASSVPGKENFPIAPQTQVKVKNPEVYQASVLGAVSERSQTPMRLVTASNGQSYIVLPQIGVNPVFLPTTGTSEGFTSRHSTLPNTYQNSQRLMYSQPSRVYINPFFPPQTSQNLGRSVVPEVIEGSVKLPSPTPHQLSECSAKAKASGTTTFMQSSINPSTPVTKLPPTDSASSVLCEKSKNPALFQDTEKKL